jgi:hypothetical protein
MATISREIEIDGVPSAVAPTWQHFIDSVLTGKQKLACSEVACVDAVQLGLVTFKPAPGGRTVVSFNLTVPSDAEGPTEDDFALLVARDLVVFKDYVERGGHGVGQPATAEKKAMAGDDRRRGTRTARESAGADARTAAYRDQFPR